MLRVKQSLLPLMLAAVWLGCQSSEKKTDDSPAQQENSHPALAGEVSYTAPDGWIAEPPSNNMRKAQFRWPGVEGAADGELVVFHFPGTGGSVQANLDRWYGQFKQPDGSDTRDHAEQRQLRVNGLDVTVVSVTGTYLKSQSPMMMSGPFDELPDYAMLAAIVAMPNGNWFFKAVGPQKTIAHWRASFDAFVQTLQAS
ncbi:MAG: hypothetical protein ONB48_09570 [candidate division KSB1 bacterium]|nr:hypothetical protein [candidate division KSB1 bacterium]MDZ7273735.1 hypothetical protein [candidate division KSB1 bacterium]MDZ7285891.1 hypothetical protein [candidate division KSB1 bacterium]MDZ7298923.1 hypothetical protein [candidate division KSB1 bacterium]MDZ7307909.1 hypothetical protein [candidate division KSB1 bacterium]